MTGIILRIVRQIANDKRSLGLILLAPIFILTLLYLLLGDSPYIPTVGVKAGVPAQIVSKLEENDLHVVTLQSGDEPDKLLEDGKIDAFVSLGAGGVTIRMLEPDSVKMSKITSAVRDTVMGAGGSAGISYSYIYGDLTSTFDSLGYVLLGVMAFFVVFVLSGVSFIRERTTGTMERLMLTPVKRREVALGYTLGFGIFAALQSVVIIVFAQLVLGLHFSGSVALAILIMILLAFSAVAMGTFVSIFANNEFQVVQFIPIVIIPQIFFSGMIAVDTLPYHLGLLSYIMPIWYGCTALKDVIIKGSGFEAVWPYLAILLGFVLVLSAVNTLALKKYRKI